MDNWHAEYAPLGAALLAARAQRNLTQVQLAEIVGLSAQRIVRLEKAQGKMSALELIVLARALGDAFVLPPADGRAATRPAKAPPGYYNLEHLFR